MIKDLLDVIRKTETWKKVVVLLLILITFVRIGYIVVKDEKSDRESVTSNITEDGSSYVDCDGLSAQITTNSNKLDFIELKFGQIPDDPEGYVFVRIFNSEKPVYEDKVFFEDLSPEELVRLRVNVRIEKGETYRIEMSASEDGGEVPTVMAKEDGSVLAINLISYENASPVVKLVKAAAWVVLLIAAISLFILSGLLKGKKTFIDEIREDKFTSQVIISVIELISLIAVTDFSGTPFKLYTKIALIFVSAIAVISYPKKSHYVRSLANTSWKRALLVALYVYAAFAMVGQRIFIYPFYKMPSIRELIAFALTVIWFIPIVNSVIWYFDQIRQRVFTEKKKMNTVLFVSIIAVILLIPLEIYLYAYNPGISSVDTSDTMISNAKFIHGMFDWHPFSYCWVTMILTSIWDSPYIMVFSQQLMYLYVMLELFLFLRRKGVKETFLIICAALTSIYIPNLILVTTIWKDVPYDLALLWVFILVAKLVIDRDYYKKKWFIYLEIAIALSVICLLRKNGFVPAIIVVVFLFTLIIKNAKLILSLAMSLIIIFTFQFPMSAYYGVVKSSDTGVHIGLGQDVMGVYYAGGDMSNDTSEIVADMTQKNMHGYRYIATWSRGSYYIDASVPQFVVGYMDTFARNPLMTVRAVVARQDELWNIWQGNDMLLSCECYIGTMDGKSSEGYEWNDYYPARKETAIYSTLNDINLSTAIYQPLEAVTWRCGIFTLLAVIAIAILILKDKMKGMLTVLSPVLGQILGLMLSTGWAEFRYYWCINLINIAFLMIAMIMENRKAEEEVKTENA